jgi:hypothetical protein
MPLGSNPSRRGGKPATNRLSSGYANCCSRELRHSDVASTEILKEYRALTSEALGTVQNLQKYGDVIRNAMRHSLFLRRLKITISFSGVSFLVSLIASRARDSLKVGDYSWFTENFMDWVRHTLSLGSWLPGLLQVIGSHLLRYFYHGKSRCLL